MIRGPGRLTVEGLRFRVQGLVFRGEGVEFGGNGSGFSVERTKNCFNQVGVSGVG